MTVKAERRNTHKGNLEKQQKRQHKLNSLKNEFEGGKVQNFSQIFAIFSRSPLSAELDIPFYTFKAKVANPGDFTINELTKFSELINVEVDIILQFIFRQISNGKVPPKTKGK